MDSLAGSVLKVIHHTELKATQVVLHLILVYAANYLISIVRETLLPLTFQNPEKIKAYYCVYKYQVFPLARRQT